MKKPRPPPFINNSIANQPKLPKLSLKSSNYVTPKNIIPLSTKYFDNVSPMELIMIPKPKISNFSIEPYCTEPEIRASPFSPMQQRKLPTRQKLRKPTRLIPKNQTDSLGETEDLISNKLATSIGDRQVFIQAYNGEYNEDGSTPSAHSRVRSLGLFPSSFAKTKTSTFMDEVDFDEPVIEPTQEVTHQRKILTNRHRITTRAALKYFTAFEDLKHIAMNKKNPLSPISSVKKSVEHVEVPGSLKERITTKIKEKDGMLEARKTNRSYSRHYPRVSASGMPMMIKEEDIVSRRTSYQKGKERYSSAMKGTEYENL